MDQYASLGDKNVQVAHEAPVVQVAVPAVAVPTPVPFGNQLAQSGIAAGNAFLVGLKGIYVRQHIEIFEVLTGCETKNRYSMTPIGQDASIPAVPSSGWARELRTAAGFNPFLKAKEESECFQRVCCPLFRGFKMPFQDGNRTTFIELDRPFKCDPCYAPPLCTCSQQELSASAGGPVVARAVEVTGACCTTGCCARKFEVRDASGKLLYVLEANDCQSKTGGSNCCAPSCLNEALTVDVTDAAGNSLPPSTFVWPGCNCGGLQDMSNMVVQFPEGSSADERTAIMTGMFLIEFTVMETRRNNNNNNGGGGGGAPPASQEMAR